MGARGIKLIQQHQTHFSRRIQHSDATGGCDVLLMRLSWTDLEELFRLTLSREPISGWRGDERSVLAAAAEYVGMCGPTEGRSRRTHSPGEPRSPDDGRAQVPGLGFSRRGAGRRPG